MTGCGGEAHLHDELAHAYRRLDQLARELAAEQALTRRLRAVIALAPFNAVRRPRYRPRRGAADARRAHS